MKKLLIYLFLFSIVLSCTTDVKFNNPAFEGQKDNVFWRAIDSRATLGANGSLIIEGFTRNEIITLNTSSTAPKTYILGTSASNMATYVLTDLIGISTYSTGIGIRNGEVVIDEYDAVNKTVSGTFKFNAENINDKALPGSTLNFQYGNFYKVPVRN